WIKGEVTFRGLQETLIEPTSRVAIQRFSPENKDGSRVISSIQLKTRNQQGRKSFSQTLELNPGLNAIIGSRSSGKSILAASIAYACSPSDRKSTRLNSSHVSISYAVFCLTKKKHLFMTNDVVVDFYARAF